MAQNANRLEFDIDRDRLTDPDGQYHKRSELYDPSVSKLVEGDNVYAIVETFFLTMRKIALIGNIGEQ